MTQNPAVLKIDGLAPREIKNIRYSLRRAVDSDGQPTSKVTIEGISVRVKALEDGNTDFVQWMCDSYEHKKGTITFSSTNKLQQLKELKFERGYLVYYQESYDEGTGLIEEFEISPQKLSVADAEVEEIWANQIV